MWAPECAEEHCITPGASQGCGEERGLGGGGGGVCAQVCQEFVGAPGCCRNRAGTAAGRSGHRWPELLCRGTCPC